MPGFTKSYINNGTFSFEKRRDRGNNQDFSNNPAEVTEIETNVVQNEEIIDFQTRRKISEKIICPNNQDLIHVLSDLSPLTWPALAANT